jgi:hypothetical protein
MQSVKARSRAEMPPKKWPRHYSYNESVDEPGKLLEQGAVEIEKEVPSEDTESVKTVKPEDRDAAGVEE